MNYLGLTGLISAISLTACGGGDSTTVMPGPTIPPEAAFSSLPANSGASVASTSEVGVGSFKALFAQSIKDFSGARRPDRAKLSTGSVTLFSNAAKEMIMVLDSGVTYTFVETKETTRADGNIDYEYAEKDKPSSTNSLLVRRGQNGGRYGYFLIEPVGNVSPTRATFHYGWKTAPSAIPGVSTPTASYFGAEGGQLYTTDGRRIFGRPTSLSVNFGAKTITGDLFDNTGAPLQTNDYNLAAKISVNNVPFDANGAFDTNAITATFSDNNDPMTSIGTVSGSAEGQFYGPAANSLSGTFAGSVPISQTVAGDSTFGFNGVFSALKP